MNCKFHKKSEKISKKHEKLLDKSRSLPYNTRDKEIALTKGAVYFVNKGTNSRYVRRCSI